MHSSAILQLLKSGTHAEHTALESRLSFLAEDVTEDQYRRVLTALYGFYLPWETSIRPWRLRLFTARAEEPVRREKTPALVEDLNFYRISTGSLPVYRQTPPIHDLPAALGNLYVMEGATLGGQIIARNLEKKLGLHDRQGYKFFSGYGSETGAMWRVFQHCLLEHSTPANETEVIDGALAAFRGIQRWLMEAGF